MLARLDAGRSAQGQAIHKCAISGFPDIYKHARTGIVAFSRSFSPRSHILSLSLSPSLPPPAPPLSLSLPPLSLQRVSLAAQRRAKKKKVARSGLLYGKRDLLICGKRDLLTCGKGEAAKRQRCASELLYDKSKRDLLTQKRPANPAAGLLPPLKKTEKNTYIHTHMHTPGTLQVPTHPRTYPICAHFWRRTRH